MQDVEVQVGTVVEEVSEVMSGMCMPDVPRYMYDVLEEVGEGTT